MPRMRKVDAVRSWYGKYVNPPRYKKPAETLQLHTVDGVKLHAVRLNGPEGCGATVVLSHGFANWHRHPKIHDFATSLAKYVNVIVLDLRGHGKSEGISTLGAYEWLDVMAAVEQVPDSDALILLGTSMGSGASVIYAGMAGRGQAGRTADAVIAVSGPAWWGGRDAARGVGRVLELAASPFMRLALKYLMRVRIAGPGRDGRIDPVSVVGDIAPSPLVIIHDKADWYFGPDQVEAMVSAAGPNAQLWWREGGHATDLFNKDLLEQILWDVIAPVVAMKKLEVDELQRDGSGAVEVVAEVGVKPDRAVVVDDEPAPLHVAHTPIFGT